MNECAFETILRTAYTHGFENIYALENVDAKSIRPFQAYSEDPSKNSKKKPAQNTIEEPRQLEFNFGVGFHSWIEPLLLFEPVHVLELHRFSEKILEQHQIKCLKDLLAYDFQEFITKGIGQGHVDEIRQKLKHYVQGKSLQKNYLIDFASFMRVLFGDVSKKKVYLFLQHYDLQDLVPLSPAESMEIKRLTESKRREWLHEASVLLTQDGNIRFVHSKIHEIAHNLCVPWMERRGGFASIHEILTRLESISHDSSLVEKCFIFFSGIYYSGNFPLGEIFPKVAEGVFAIDSHFLSMFDKVRDLALTYFYKGSTSYTLDELILWLRREFAKQWLDFSEEVIRRVLVLSPVFSIWKNTKGLNEIKLG